MSNTPSPDWLIQDLLLNDTIAAIHGEAKTHKTQLALEMAVSVARGTPCLDQFAATNSGPVLVISPEIAVAEQLARLARNEASREVGGRIQRLARNEAARNIHMLIGAPGHWHEAVLDRIYRDVFKPRLIVIDDLEISDSRDAVLSVFDDMRSLKTTILLTRRVAPAATRRPPGSPLRGSHALLSSIDSSLWTDTDDGGKSVNVTVDHKAVRPGLSLRVRSESHDPRLQLVRV